MSVVDVIETEFRLNDKYSNKMRNIEAATSSFAKSFDKVNRAQLMGGFAAKATMVAGAIGAIGIALGANAMQDSARFDSLVKGLEAVEGSAERARAKIEELRELAKAPGIGFEQAVVGYGGLRRNGVSDSMSQALVREAGNANAASGGDVAKYEQIMRAFMQIAAKPKLQGDELLQLNEAGLPIQKMLKEAFGTADPEQLAKAGKSGTDVLEGLIKVMAKMPRVGGGFQNVLDNMSDALNRASVEVGDGLNRALLPMLEGLGEEISKMSEDGKFKEIGETLAGAASSIMESAGGIQGIATSFEIIANASPEIMSNLAAIGKWFADWSDPERWFDPKAFNWPEVFGGGKDESASAAENIARMEGYRGKDGKGPTVAEQIQARKDKEAARDNAKRDEEAKKEKDKEADKANPATNFLKKIEENTRALPELTKTILGGGELGRMGVTSRDVKAQRQSRKVAKGIENMAAIQAAPMFRLSRR